MRFLITGTSGLIGYHLALTLLKTGHEIVGYDGMTPYYDVSLKQARLDRLSTHANFVNVTAMLEDTAALARAGDIARPDVIIHLAAQAGVRYSLENPDAYLSSNVTGSWNVLELARKLRPRHLLLASTSSVYGANAKIPFAETDRADEPLTLYAATKRSMELMAHASAHLWRVPITVLRFFTVYGPYGRPDMALFKFVAAIETGEPIDVYGEGRLIRDFTYIDDLVRSMCALVDLAPDETNRVGGSGLTDSLSQIAPFRVVNLGGGNPVGLIAFIEAIEAVMGKTAIKRMLPMQPGDVPRTYSSTALLDALIGPAPTTQVHDGIRAFVSWYRSFYAESNCS
jgi:UDP-glucuronate 4-epimerase